MAETTAAGEKTLALKGLEESGVTWIHIEKPTTADSQYLARRFPFHPLSLEDILSHQIRPKIDEFSDHLFVVLRFPFYDEEHKLVVSAELDIFIGKGYLVTIDCIGRLRGVARLLDAYQTDEKMRQDDFSKGSGYLLYRILDGLVDRRLPLIAQIDKRIEAVEDNLLSGKPSGVISEISSLRRDIIAMRGAIWPGRNLIAEMEPRIAPYANMNLKPYLNEVANHLDIIWDSFCEYKEVIEGLNDTHLSLAQYRSNDILRVLTIVMLVGTVLTVVVGFFGMNIPLQPLGSDPGGHVLAWAVIVLMCIAVTGVMMLYFWRKGWL
ncbi:MAG: magnesium transporter CorA family protein [Chloroflexota bacterium]